MCHKMIDVLWRCSRWQELANISAMATVVGKREGISNIPINLWRNVILVLQRSRCTRVTAAQRRWDFPSYSDGRWLESFYGVSKTLPASSSLDDEDDEDEEELLSKGNPKKISFVSFRLLAFQKLSKNLGKGSQSQLTRSFASEPRLLETFCKNFRIYVQFGSSNSVQTRCFGKNLGLLWGD